MSTAPRIPTVRLPTVIPDTSDESTPQGSVILDLPPSGKFGFAWPADAGPVPSLQLQADHHISLSSSDAESAPSEHEHESEEKAGEKSFKTRRWSTGAGKKGYGDGSDDSDFTTPTNRLNLDKNPLDQAPPPRLSRAFSVPLPSQIGYLKNPKRSPLLVSPPPEMQSSSDMIHIHELSLELADSVQMIIQTLLQLSPPQLFDPAKEQLSACALPIPIPSISALFTVMKSLNYMSANMAAFSTPLSSPPCEPSNQTINVDPNNSAISNAALQAPESSVRDFDIGETLQGVGDALSGMAADIGVDLVLFHGDVGMKHIAVKGDEIGISYALSHIIRQILATALGGDCVQVGLFLVAPVAVSPEAAESSVIEIPLDASEPADAISNPDPNLPLRCTFQIIHTFAHNTAKVSIPPGTITGSRKPALESLILRRLVHHISASLTCELTDMASTCKLSMTLERGSPAVVNPVIILSDNDPILQAYPDIKLSEEPTLEDLAQFVGSLKGKRVFLYADAAGIFAQHLTSYLTSWGLYVSHASSDSDTEGSDAVNIPSVEHPPVASEARGGASILQTLDEQDLDLPPSAPQTPKAPNHGPSFILIDDDISVLRERLQKLRVDVPHPFQFSRKRPNLAANHRPRSSPQVIRSIGHSSISSSPRNASVIVHFTSLANFKLVKGILQSVLGPNLGTTSRLPEVIIIPKPAGPRRVLTALHTAAVRPIVDPFFSPIATSPISPGLYPAASYFHQNLSPKSPMSRPSSSPRTYSNHSMRSPKAAVEPISDAFALPPSPLGLTEGIDYFAEAAEKLGSSPSSGLVIQSPSGQPAGIFFHPPRARGSRPSSQSVSAENTVYSRGSRRHSDSAERTRPAGGVTFLNLPTSIQQRCSSIAQVTPGPTGSGTATHMTAIPGGEVPAAAGYTGTSPGTRQVGKRTGAIEVLRKTASPPSSPRTSPTGAKQTPARWGSGSRRSQAEKGTSPSPMRKSKPTEPSIVPPISVLIVEDNPINQTLLSTFMRKKKIKYDVAKNGEEAVEKWSSGRFHLILMDIQMPVMDGISATKEIRRLEKLNSSQGYPGTPQTEGQRTPSDISSDSRMSSSPFRSSVIIVALTASSLQSDRVAALAAGCNDFLTKPVSLEWLNNKIIEWGSIKALQMFADSRPDFVKSVSAGQAVQAQNIARRLHMPEGRISPAPSRPLSQPVVSGVVSTAGPGSAQPGPDDLAHMDNSIPSHVYKSFSSIQEVLNGSLELNRAPGGNAQDTVTSGATAYTENSLQLPEPHVGDARQ